MKAAEIIANAIKQGIPPSEVRPLPTNPLISVLVCNYNNGKYIAHCITGLLRQKYQNIEVIVTDDGSTDESKDILRHYEAKDPRFHINYFPKNRGVAATLEDVFGRASGDLIFAQGGDDFVSSESFFLNAVNSLVANPKAAGFFGRYCTLSATKDQLENIDGKAHKEGYITPEEFFPAFLRNQIFVPGSSSIWRHDLLEAMGGYTLPLGPQVDFFINHALPCRYGVIYQNKILACMRTYEKRTNFGSKGSFWEAAHRYELIENSLREIAPHYAEMNQDFKIWRATWLAQALNCYQ